MKKKLIIAGIVVVLAAAALILVLVLHKKPIPKEPGSFERRTYKVENGKKVLQTEERHYLDKDGNLVYEFAKGVGSSPQITRREYDSQGRVIATKSIKERWFGEKVIGARYTEYYKDTELVTSEKCYDGDDEELLSYRYYEYDDQQRVICERSSDGGLEEITKTTYNDQGVVIGKEVTYGDTTYVAIEYNPVTNKVTEYDNDTNRRTGEPSERTVSSVTELNDDGTISVSVRYRQVYNEETKQFDLVVSSSDKYVYHTNDDSDYAYEICSTYDDGRVVWEFFDRQNRSCETAVFEDGKLVRQTVTDYNAEDPDFPGESVEVTKIYEMDEHFEKQLVQEYRKKRVPGYMEQYKYMYNTNRPLIYRWDKLEDGNWVNRVECKFYPDGKLKEYITEVVFDSENEGCRAVDEHDEHGLMTRSVTYDANGNVTEEMVSEIKYY